MATDKAIVQFIGFVLFAALFAIVVGVVMGCAGFVNLARGGGHGELIVVAGAIVFAAGLLSMAIVVRRSASD